MGVVVVQGNLGSLILGSVMHISHDNCFSIFGFSSGLSFSSLGEPNIAIGMQILVNYFRRE